MSGIPIKNKGFELMDTVCCVCLLVEGTLVVDNAPRIEKLIRSERGRVDLETEASRS